MATGVELATAWVRLVPTVGGISGAISKAVGGSEATGALKRGGRSMGSVLTGAIGGAVAMATSKAISAVTGSINSAIKRVDTMRNFPKIMENLGYSAGDAEKSIKKMSDRLSGLPTSLDSMAGMVQQLAPLTGGLDEATELSLALNNALLAGGKSTDQQANAMEQYTQMLAVGKVDMAAWRSMVSAMPGQMDQLSVSLLGAGNKSMDLYEAMKSGEVSFEDFNGAVLKLNSEGVGAFASFEDQARSSTDGIATAQANLQTGITRGLATLIDKFQPQIVGMIAGLTAGVGIAVNVLGTVLDWIVAHGDQLKPVIITVGALVAAYLAFRGVTAVINGVRAAMAVWRAVQIGWTAATYGGVAASYASTTAAKVGLVAHKLWNSVIAVGKGLWALMNGSLIKSAALWVKNTAQVVAHRIATVANNAGVGLWLKLAGMQIAAGWKATAMWVKNTAAMAAQKTALVASTVATKAAAAGQRLLNLALNANPIGLVITAVTALVGALVWFFTKTEIGRKIWAEFVSFLSDSWEWIKNAFSVSLEWIKNVWSSSWNAIKSFFTGLWDSVTGWFQKKLDYWKLVFKIALGILKNTWSTVWNNIKSFFTGIWDGITGWFTSKLDYWKLVFRLALDILKSTWSNIWNSIKSTFSNVWNAIKGTFNTMISFVKTKPVEAFRAARDGIGKAWDGIKALAKKPVKFVIETVFNGMIGALNKIPGVNLKKIALPKGFRVGGYTGNVGVNAPAGVVHGQEFVTRAESTRKLMRNHPGVLEHMNRFGEIPGYRKGGLVHPLPGATDTGGWMSYPGHRGQDWAKPQGSLIRAALSGRIVYAGWGEGWGNNILIDHGGGFSTRYAHIMHGGFLRRSGAVTAGQTIAKVGSTGRSTGPHLHFETLENGVRVNPAPYLSGAKTGGGFDVIAGLKDWATEKFNSFGENNLFVDAAKGVMTSGVTKLIDWGKSKLGFGGDGLVPTLFDNGGWLDPGTHFVANRTRSPEPILTGNQWDALTSRDSLPRQMRLVVGDREFDAYVEEIADANTRAHLSPMSPRRVRAELGVS